MGETNRFLVVDDSPTVRKHLSYLIRLVSEGDEEIREASTPAEALFWFRQMPNCTVFLDVMMPTERDGAVVLKAILKEKPDATVVLVTALDQDHPAVQKSVSQGVVGYVRKPVTIKSLQVVIDELRAQAGRFRRVT